MRPRENRGLFYFYISFAAINFLVEIKSTPQQIKYPAKVQIKRSINVTGTRGKKKDKKAPRFKFSKDEKNPSIGLKPKVFSKSGRKNASNTLAIKELAKADDIAIITR